MRKSMDDKEIKQHGRFISGKKTEKSDSNFAIIFFCCSDLAWGLRGLPNK